MNPNNNSNEKQVWYIVILVIIIIALFFIFRGNKSTDNMMNDSASTTTPSMNDGTINNDTSGTGAGGTGSTGGTGATAGIPSTDMINSLIRIAKVRPPSSGVDVSLSSGTAEYKTGAKTSRITLGKIYGKYATTDGYDVLVQLQVWPDVTQSMNSTNYVALFHVVGNTARYTSAITVGANTEVKSIEAKPDPALAVTSNPNMFDSVKGYLITVFYLEQRPGAAATSTPNISKDFGARIKNHIVSK